METSPEIPNSEQANGISKREPPAIPEVPQAASVDRMHKTNAEGASHAIPSVFAAARVITVIVMAAPSMLIVAPSGMETEYISSSSPSFLQSSMLTGLFAAEPRVKKAVMPLSFKQRRTSGYGFFLRRSATISGETTRLINSMEPTSTRMSFP